MIARARVPEFDGSTGSGAYYVCATCYGTHETWNVCGACRRVYDPQSTINHADNLRLIAEQPHNGVEARDAYLDAVRLLDESTGLCASCVQRCAVVGCSSPRTATPFGQSSTTLCAIHRQQAVTGSLASCNRCGQYASSLIARGRATNLICANCHEAYEIEAERARNGDAISSYTANPITKHGFVFPPAQKRFKGTQAPLMLGLELELECSSDTQRYRSAREALNRVPDQAIVKNDGSLSCGIEIVSVPLSGQAGVNKYLDDLFRDDNLPGTRVDSTCGMHVHISREALDATHIGRLVAFFYNSRNGRLLDHAAGRDLTSATYCSRTSMGDAGRNVSWLSAMLSNRESTYEALSYKQKLRLMRSPAIGRYTAINFQRAATIEFRLFAGTNDPDVAKRNVEFVLATVEFTRPGFRAYTDLGDPRKFLKFIESNRKTYPRLYRKFSKCTVPAVDKKPAKREMLYTRFQVAHTERYDTLFQSVTRKVVSYEEILAKQKAKHERAKRSAAGFQGVGDAQNALEQLYSDLGLVFAA